MSHLHSSSHILRFLWLLIIIRPVSVLLHELGHAMAAILITNKPASIFIGSYGDNKKSLKLTISKLTIYFKPGFVSFSQGLCICDIKTMTTNNRIIFLLSGPLASALCALASLAAAITFRQHDLLSSALILLFVSTLWDFVVNLMPIRKTIKLHNGKATYNDGFSILTLLNWQRYQNILPKYNEYIKNERYKEALTLIEPIFKPRISNVEIYRNTIIMASNVGEEAKMTALYLQAVKYFTLTAAEHSSMGVLLAMQDNLQEAMNAFNKSIETDKDLGITYVNRGFCNLVMKNYHAAITDLECALSKGEPSAYCYANIGLAKIKLGDIENGLTDIEQAIGLDPGEAYAYRSKGVYYMDKGDTIKALNNFEKAKNLNTGCYEIDELIASAS